jgi:hypothetical protein
MPQVGFEPTILVFERVKIVHGLERGHSNLPRHPKIGTNAADTEDLPRFTSLVV